MTYDEAIQIAQVEASPRDIAHARSVIAGNYAFMSGLLTEILMRKPALWMKIRDGVKSDTRAEREWQMREDGRKEIEYSRKLKSMEKIMSAMSTRLKVADAESINNY